MTNDDNTCLGCGHPTVFGIRRPQGWFCHVCDPDRVTRFLESVESALEKLGVRAITERGEG
jgi:hypothetical protein